MELEILRVLETDINASVVFIDINTEEEDGTPHTYVANFDGRAEDGGFEEFDGKVYEATKGEDGNWYVESMGKKYLLDLTVKW